MVYNSNGAKSSRQVCTGEIHRRVMEILCAGSCRSVMPAVCVCEKGRKTCFPFLSFFLPAPSQALSLFLVAVNRDCSRPLDTAAAYPRLTEWAEGGEGSYGLRIPPSSPNIPDCPQPPGTQSPSPPRAPSQPPPTPAARDGLLLPIRAKRETNVPDGGNVTAVTEIPERVAARSASLARSRKTFCRFEISRRVSREWARAYNLGPPRRWLYS